MRLQPPRSTLFPYTTLFRSGGEMPMSSRWPGRIGGSIRCLPRADEDRKSTRLNSSHTVISYAVFCLKKKRWYYIHNEDSSVLAMEANRARPTVSHGEAQTEA